MPEGALSVHILSDSIGETAEAVALAALAQFDEDVFDIERLPKVSSPAQLQELVGAHCGPNCIFLYTLAEKAMQAEMERISSELHICAVDVLGPAIAALSEAAGVAPSREPGAMRRTDRGYFDRIAALEFAVKHDDGRNPEGLLEAEIVLIGVSRTSKTPLAMYLAFKGYRCANVPLALGTDPPVELYQVNVRRLFGLVSDPDVLAEIRQARTRELGAYARNYAGREAVERELEEARSLMRQLGCLVIHTDNRAIEESAQEILRYLEG